MWFNELQHHKAMLNKCIEIDENFLLFSFTPFLLRSLYLTTYRGMKRIFLNLYFKPLKTDL